MANDVDDIFKLFVHSKMKELGMNGLSFVELETSLKNSALDKHVEVHASNVSGEMKELPNEEETTDIALKGQKKMKKHKKEKKKKNKKEKEKHKKEKHQKKIPKSSPLSIFKVTDSVDHAVHSSTLGNSQNNTCKNVPLKKKILEDEETEVLIKTKQVNCYHDTVTKLKEIEKLPLSLEQAVTCSDNNNFNHSDKLKNTSEDYDIVSLIKPPPIKPSVQKDNKTVLKREENIVENTTANQDATKTTEEVNSIKNPVNKNETEDNSKICSNSNGPKVSATEMKIVESGQITDNQVEPGEITVLDPAPKTEASDKTSNAHKRSRSPSSKHRKQSKSHHRSRKRSRRSQSRHKSRSRSPRRHHKYHHHHHKSRSRDSHRRHKSSSKRKRSPSPIISSRDKVKLLEIAKANVLAQHKADITVSNLSHESKALLRSGGVTLQQLTGVCQDIAEGKREVFVAETSGEVKPTKVHHPFQVREPQTISINIRNALPAPPVPAKPITELTKEFPVSCGSQHQRKEVLEEVYGKWEPIVKDEATKNTIKAVIEEKVFSEAPTDPSLTIKEVIAQRVSAVRELQSNPADVKAIKNIVETQHKLDSWTKAKVIPGRFTGSTGLQPLSRSELERGHQAWASNNTFNSGKQVGGIGKSLLQKMGWKEGESLGKTNMGMVEPLRMQVKTDRKGLSSMMEAPAPSAPAVPKNRGGGLVLHDLSGKHPVSALMEICSKRKWKPPEFVLVRNDGPDHHRYFMFKVMVNDIYYQPSVPSVNKKQAKAQAATAALQAMGLVSS